MNTVVALAAIGGFLAMLYDLKFERWEFTNRVRVAIATVCGIVGLWRVWASPSGWLHGLVALIAATIFGYTRRGYCRHRKRGGIYPPSQFVAKRATIVMSGIIAIIYGFMAMMLV